MDAIIAHGVIPATAALLDEPNLLIQSLTITPQRTEQRFRGPNRATQGITETDPVMDFAFSAIITAQAGLATQQPGTLCTGLANFVTGATPSTVIHGFDEEDGILVYRDPSRSLDTENPDTLNFTVTHFPFVDPPA